MSAARGVARRRLKRGAMVLGLALAMFAAWFATTSYLIDKRVDEGFPGGRRATGDGSGGGAVLTAGRFEGADAVHRGRGRASIRELPGGGRKLRLEEFDVTNGPALYVYLSARPAPRGKLGSEDGAALRIAPLKGNVGNQNYDLPAGLDVSAYESVVIYCERFDVVFATARLSGRKGSGFQLVRRPRELTVESVGKSRRRHDGAGDLSGVNVQPPPF